MTKTEEDYFDGDGFVYLKKLYGNDLDGRGSQRVLSVLSSKGGRSLKFPTEKSFYSDCIESYIDLFSNDGECLPVVCDARVLDVPLLNIKNKNIKRIFQFHGVHFGDGSLKESFRVVNKASCDDVIVCLTPEQKKDIERDYSPNAKIVVIPHGVAFGSILPNVTRKNVVFIGRLHAQKRIKDSIDAFGKVVKIHPELKFHIYGEGAEAENIALYISKKGLSQVCEMKGYVSNPEDIFSNSLCSFNTSIFEGFCMSILESLGYGCPVVSYDIKYGPKSMIVNGVNGFLVEEGDIDSFSKAISNIATRKLDQNSVCNSIEQFSQESFLSKWEKLLM